MEVQNGYPIEEPALYLLYREITLMFRYHLAKLLTTLVGSFQHNFHYERPEYTHTYTHILSNVSLVYVPIQSIFSLLCFPYMYVYCCIYICNTTYSNTIHSHTKSVWIYLICDGCDVVRDRALTEKTWSPAIDTIADCILSIFSPLTPYVYACHIPSHRHVCCQTAHIGATNG